MHGKPPSRKKIAKEVVAVRTSIGWQPIDDAGREIHKATRLGHKVLLSVKNTDPRSLAQHRLFFAMLQILVEHHVYINTEVARFMLLVQTGNCEWYSDPFTGVLHPVPHSMSFKNMQQDDFKLFFDSAVKFVAEKLDVSHPEIMTEIYALLDGPDKEALGVRIK